MYELSHGQTVKFNVSALAPNDQSSFLTAMSDWENALSTHAGNFSVNFEPGTGEWVASYDQGMVGSGLWAITNRNTKTIKFNPEVTGYSGFF
jgi:hypothetical protein